MKRNILLSLMAAPLMVAAQAVTSPNGTVEVRPWIDADVEDWQNGGTFS